jgi:hypothetical protein
MTKGLNAQGERRLKVQSVKATIKEIYSNGEDVEDKEVYERFVFQIQQRYGCTETKAKEYIKEALFAHKLEIAERIEYSKQMEKVAEKEADEVFNE